ncbi:MULTISPECIES: CoA pyrophosphatase [unclassified Virgibacillus]|uniref:NUDIX hydrolase n=1 Tax=unclassified Virgibacillus TaxID=2620237 RepID=UPI0024DE9843|nr:CoA pyrophosphatase [Virgibacillus sp. LDC-1]
MNSTRILAQLKGRKPTIMGIEELRTSAVLLPLINVKNEVHVLFETRSMNLRRQPGDICFPGGRIESTDQGPLQCAIRETAEELGLQSSDIIDVTPLDYIVSDFGRMIYPYAGTITQPEKITPNPHEVENVFTVPLRFFQQTDPKRYNVSLRVTPEADFPFDLIVGGKDYNWQVPQVEELFYLYKDKVIWGLTAKIVTHFVSLLTEEHSS